MLIILDILGGTTEEELEQEEECVEAPLQAEVPILRKQVISISGDIVEVEE